MKDKNSILNMIMSIGFGFIFIWFLAFLVNIIKLDLYRRTFWYVGMGIAFISIILYYWLSSKSEKLENIFANTILIGFGLFTLSIIVMMVKFCVKNPIWLISLGIGLLILTIVDKYSYHNN